MKKLILYIREKLIKQSREDVAKRGTILNSLTRGLLKFRVQFFQKTKAQEILKEMKNLNSPKKTIDWSRENMY